MNLYYLIAIGDLDRAAQLAPATGLPNQLLQAVSSPNGTKAVVQADWQDVEAMDAIGTRLGALLPNGFAEQAVYDYLESDDWLLS